MKSAFLTETQYQGKWPENFPNTRTEIAWQIALQADHFNIHSFDQVKGYDAVFIIFPKATAKLNICGVEMTTPMVDKDISIYSKPVVETLKTNNAKVCYIQEGPSYFFNEYDMPTQFNFYNQLAICDIIFAHNEYDTHFYKGLFPHCKVSVIPSLMITTNISPSQIYGKEDKAIIGGNFCFLPDTRVLLSSGNYTPISDISINDKVIVNGSVYSILHKFENHINENIIEIETYGNRRIRCTANHKINGVFRKEHVLWNGSRQRPVDREKIKQCNIDEIPAKNLTIGDFILVPKSKIIEKSKYSDDLMWLFGFWIAEGNIEKRKDRLNGLGIGRIEFSIHKNEDIYAGKVKRILNANFNIQHFEDRINKGTNSRIIRCSDQKLAKFLMEAFGDGALNKKIPLEFFYYDNILILLRGIFCGDGTFYKSKSKSYQYSVVTGSSILGDNISTIMDFNGIRYSKTYCYNRKLSSTRFTRISVCNKIDIDLIGGNKILQYNAKDKCTQYKHDDGILIPIKNIKITTYNGPVYNIDVDKIHKYIVEGMLVNNCHWYGGFQSYVVATEFECPIFVPCSHCKRRGEEQVPNLTHLPWVMWNDWMKQLSSFKYAVNLMPTVAAGTFSMNCSYFGIPCIGNEKVDTQLTLFPELSVDVNDIHSARHLAMQLKNDIEFYEHTSHYAKKKLTNSVYCDIDEWIHKIEFIINNI